MPPNRVCMQAINTSVYACKDVATPAFPATPIGRSIHSGLNNNFEASPKTCLRAGGKRQAERFTVGHPKTTTEDVFVHE